MADYSGFGAVFEGLNRSSAKKQAQANIDREANFRADQAKQAQANYDKQYQLQVNQDARAQSATEMARQTQGRTQADWEAAQAQKAKLDAMQADMEAALGDFPPGEDADRIAVEIYNKHGFFDKAKKYTEGLEDRKRKMIENEQADQLHAKRMSALNAEEQEREALKADTEAKKAEAAREKDARIISNILKDPAYSNNAVAAAKEYAGLTGKQVVSLNQFGPRPSMEDDWHFLVEGKPKTITADHRKKIQAEGQMRTPEQLAAEQKYRHAETAEARRVEEAEQNLTDRQKKSVGEASERLTSIWQASKTNDFGEMLDPDAPSAEFVNELKYRGDLAFRDSFSQAMGVGHKFSADELATAFANNLHLLKDEKGNWSADPVAFAKWRTAAETEMEAKMSSGKPGAAGKPGKGKSKPAGGAVGAARQEAGHGGSDTSGGKAGKGDTSWGEMGREAIAGGFKHYTPQGLAIQGLEMIQNASLNEIQKLPPEEQRKELNKMIRLLGGKIKIENPFILGMLGGIKEQAKKVYKDAGAWPELLGLSSAFEAALKQIPEMSEIDTKFKVDQ